MKNRKRIVVGIILVLAVIIFALFTIYFVIPRISTGDVNLPVLMYHHLADEITEGTVVTAERFEEQISALKEDGYTAVNLNQIIDYVENGTALPDKPVLITFDDGYTSNLELAAPILEKYEMCATIFVIGVNEGKEIYIHSGNPLYPTRFSYEDAMPWIEKGIIDVQSHSYDMHQLESYGFSGRDGMRKLDDESDEEYLNAIREDMAAFEERRAGKVSTDLTALAYPFGYYTEELDEMLEGLGIKATFTTEGRINPLKTGDMSCLRMMGRFNITQKLSGRLLLLWIK